MRWQWQEGGAPRWCSVARRVCEGLNGRGATNRRPHSISTAAFCRLGHLPVAAVRKILDTLHPDDTCWTLQALGHVVMRVRAAQVQCFWAATRCGATVVVVCFLPCHLVVGSG